MIKIGTKVVLHYLNTFFPLSVKAHMQLGRQDKWEQFCTVSHGPLHGRVVSITVPWTRNASRPLLPFISKWSQSRKDVYKLRRRGGELIPVNLTDFFLLDSLPLSWLQLPLHPQLHHSSMQILHCFWQGTFVLILQGWAKILFPYSGLHWPSFQSRLNSSSACYVTSLSWLLPPLPSSPCFFFSFPLSLSTHSYIHTLLKIIFKDLREKVVGRGWEKPQADFILSTEPKAGLDFTTLGSCPEQKPRVGRQLHQPSTPIFLIFNFHLKQKPLASM